MKGRARLLLAVLAASSLALLAFPAAAQTGTGALDAIVEVLEPLPPDETCILVSEDNLDFGQVPLGEGARSPSYTVSSCSEKTQDFLIRGEDATSHDDPPVTWTLGGDPHYFDGPLENTYFLSYWRAEPTEGGGFITTSSATAWTDVPALAELTVDHWLYMPTAESDGTGETMHFRIIWTAVLSY